MLFNKPFRRPSFLSKPTVPTQSDGHSSPPPAKKRRIADHVHAAAAAAADEPATRSVDDSPKAQKPPTQLRKPLLTVPNSSQLTQNAPATEEPKKFFSALWRKKTAKMHKTWDGDGTLTVHDGYASLRNEKGKYMGRTVCKGLLEPGSALSIGGMDVEVEAVLASDPNSITNLNEDVTESVSPSPRKPIAIPRTVLASLPKRALMQMAPSKGPHETKSVVDQRISLSHLRRSTSLNGLNQSAGVASSGPRPKHDPDAEGALVMQRPRNVPPGKQVVDVVVDPVIGRKLREHQRQGVAFLYECVMGYRCKEGTGAILADDMGLGKSLQTIALLWTLLKQNPIHGEPPVVRKAVIICPATVTKNWKKEFRKWLGGERIGVLLLDDQKKVRSFVRGRSYQVLVVGYEMFNIIQKDLQACDEIDLIVADEGHRLKAAKNKTTAAINALNIERRIVLTGTLLQNDYSEWYTVVDFVNPGYLSKYSTFKRDYELPILRARQQGASREDQQKGEEADKELKASTSGFILRRTGDVLAKYLPPKTEYVLLCRPTDYQAEIYNAVLTSGTLTAAMRSKELSFCLINILKKASNSPSLLAKLPSSGKDTDGDKYYQPSLLADLHAAYPPARLASATTSGKLRALDALLHHISTSTDEKVVLVSNYTSTLDIISSLLTSLSYTHLRLDGSTPVSRRQDLVDSFNTLPQSRAFVFLLSTKAGGLGLNLVGASRLVLFDADWNPSPEVQAMARICRDGQPRPCHVYRLVARGGIEERIWQRQIVKAGLAESAVDGVAGKQGFEQDVLRDLFGPLDKRAGWGTHETLGCGCGGTGRRVVRGKNAEEEEEEEAEEDRDLVEPGTGFVRASVVGKGLSPENVDDKKEKRKRKNEDEGMRGLMLFAHVDCAWYRSRYGKGEAGRAGRGGRGGGGGGGGGGSGVGGGDLGAGDAEEEGSLVGGSDVVDDDDDDGGDPLPDPVLKRVVLQENSSVDFVYVKEETRK